VAVWAGALPGAEIECFHAAAVPTDDGIAAVGFPELDDAGLVALLVDPFTFPLGPFLTRLSETHERVPLVGGIAAGGRRPDASRNRRRPQRGVTRIAPASSSRPDGRSRRSRRASSRSPRARGGAGLAEIGRARPMRSQPT
jgi:hypothetical protein